VRNRLKLPEAPLATEDLVAPAETLELTQEEDG